MGNCCQADPLKYNEIIMNQPNENKMQAFPVNAEPNKDSNLQLATTLPDN